MNEDVSGTGFGWGHYYQLLDAEWPSSAGRDGASLIVPLLCRIDRLLTTSEDGEALRLSFGVPKSHAPLAFAEVAVFRPTTPVSTYYELDHGPRSDKRHYPGADLQICCNGPYVRLTV